jgi:hypothetical protein
VGWAWAAKAALTRVHTSGQWAATGKFPLLVIKQLDVRFQLANTDMHVCTIEM